MSSATKITPAEQFSYDNVPYESFSYPQTHPAHLYTIGKLFSMDVPDFKTARILEIGGASGGNLFPIAMLYPETRCVSFDLSKAQIEDGKKHVKSLGLSNIELLQLDIMDFPEDMGEFDYIICHGVLSWIPDEVRGGLWKLISKHLKPNGLAHVSFNTLPGWHFVNALRDMMLYHTGGLEKSEDVITQSRAFLDFLYENAADGTEAYKDIIDRERKELKNANDSYLFHDHLEENNTQFYLHEVNTMMKEHGLLYVGDTAVPTMFIGNLPEKAAKMLSALGDDIIRQEQYADFLKNRRFRNMVITHASNKIDRAIRGDVYKELYIKPKFICTSDNPDINTELTFIIPGDEENNFRINKPAANALFLELAKHYNSNRIKGSDLIRRAAENYKISEKDIEAEANNNIGTLLIKSFLEFYGDEGYFMPTISDKPEAFALARHQCQNTETKVITNMIGASIPTDPRAAYLIHQMDGTKTRDNLIGSMEKFLESKGEAVFKGGQKITDPVEKKKAIGEYTDQLLIKLRDHQLLAG